MPRASFAWVATVAAVVAFQPPSLAAQSNLQTGGVDRETLRSMVEGLGYEVKMIVTDPGKEKFSVVIVTGGLDVPIGVEISNNMNYIWLTVNLGDPPSDSTSIRYARMLHRNTSIQPSHFYTTRSGRLMMGVPVENRSITPVVLRRVLQKISDDVVSTQDLWKE